MRKWTSVLAFAIAGALVATMAFGQSSGSNSTAPQKPGANQSDASSPSASPATGANKAAPSASPSTSDDASKATPGKSSDPSASGPTTSDPGKPAMKSDTMKSDSMKSDSMKSDTMKSDSMKSDMSKGRGMRTAAVGGSEQVKAIQQALKDKGHDPGTVDGVMGPKTRSALRDFQKKEGIKDTGQPDPATMSKLGVEAKTSSASDSSTGASASPAMPPSPSASDSSPAAAPAGGAQKKN